MTEPTVQCESCGTRVPESDAVMTEAPGATLAWCGECARPSRAEELGVYR